MNLRESIKHKMNCLCIFSEKRKCRVFFWIALFSSCFLHSQIYIKNGTTFTVNENTIVYSRTDSSALPSQRQKKAVIYASKETLISGLQENTNAEVLYIAAKQPIKNKKPKIIENVLAEKEQKSVKKEIPQKEAKFHYTANSEENFGFVFGQKLVAAAGSVQNFQKSGCGIFENYTADYKLYFFLIKKYNSGSGRFFRLEYSDSFKTRPPPFA